MEILVIASIRANVQEVVAKLCTLVSTENLLQSAVSTEENRVTPALPHRTQHLAGERTTSFSLHSAWHLHAKTDSGGDYGGSQFLECPTSSNTFLSVTFQFPSCHLSTVPSFNIYYLIPTIAGPFSANAATLEPSGSPEAPTSTASNY